MPSRAGGLSDVIVGSVLLGIDAGLYIGIYSIEQSSNNSTPISVSLVGVMIMIALLGLGLLTFGLHEVMKAPWWMQSIIKIKDLER
jgi:hypothetical protein